MHTQIIPEIPADEQMLILIPVPDVQAKKEPTTPRAQATPQFIQTEYLENQLLLLPPTIEQFVTHDAPARILRSMLDKLNVDAFREDCKGGGRPSYDPVVLIRIIIFGLLKGLRSSRVLEDLTAKHMDYMFLANMAKPDYRTIARFRARHEERINALYLETVKLGSVSGMIDLKHVSIDGTKIEANAAKHRYRSEQELDELIQKADEVGRALLEEWKRNDQNDDSDEAKKLKQKVMSAQQIEQQLQDAKKALASRENAKGIVVTDLDSRMMKHRSGLRPGYNAQAVVDSNSQMIIAAVVVQDEGDNLQFKPMVEEAFLNMAAYPEKISADGGYWSDEALQYSDEKKLDAYIAPSGVDPAALEGWIHDKINDTLTGPNGDIYVFEKIRNQKDKHDKKRKYRVYFCKETDSRKWMRVDIPNYTEKQKKTSTPEGAAVYMWRKAIVEPVFGHIKVSYGFRRLHLRGLTGAKIEYKLACIAHNISKLMKNHAQILSRA